MARAQKPPILVPFRRDAGEPRTIYRFNPMTGSEETLSSFRYTMYERPAEDDEESY